MPAFSLKLQELCLGDWQAQQVLICQGSVFVRQNIVLPDERLHLLIRERVTNFGRQVVVQPIIHLLKFVILVLILETVCWRQGLGAGSAALL